LRRTARASGVTLVELMVVMSIIAILMGLGMAMLTESNKDNGLKAARGAVLGTCRYARSAARNSRAPVWVRVDPQGRWIATVVRRPMGAWHFEEEPLTGALGHDAEMHDGKLFDDGRVGRAVLFGDKGGHLDCGNVPLLATHQGLLVELWYRAIQHRKQRTLVSKRGEFEIALDKEGNLAAYAGSETDRVQLYARGASLPLGKWTKIALLWDGAALTLLVNDHPLAKKTGTASFSLSDGNFTVGSGEYPLDGAVDEVRVDALIEDTRYNLPDLLAVSGPAEIRFDATGALDADAHTGPATITIRGPADSLDVTVNMLGGSQ
jgi:prepilin-type N-terminal cleavage/methylation domain-containing protein